MCLLCQHTSHFTFTVTLFTLRTQKAAIPDKVWKLANNNNKKEQQQI